MGAGMHGVPESGAGGEEVRARHERRCLVLSLIIRLRETELLNPSDPGTMVLKVNRDLGMANGLAGFIQHLTRDQAGRSQSQDEVFRVETSAGHNCGCILFMRIVTGADIPLPLTSQ